LFVLPNIAGYRAPGDRKLEGAGPVMQLRLGRTSMSLDVPRVMGILNVTPDSFSDGGRFHDRDIAIRHAEQMATEGADIIDVGGESTRPGAADVSVQEELDRIMPVIETLCSVLPVPVSVDTSKPEVMTAAVAAGAVLINDVYALRREGALAAAAGTGVAVCLMHMRGTPRTMQAAPEYDELPGDVIRFLEERVAASVEAGIDRDHIVVDPGFGFGKNDRHNLEILRNLDQFAVLGLPLLVGLSRKRTLGTLTGRAAPERLAAGVAAATIAVLKGAQIVRTHDVAATVDALRVADAVMKAGQDS
jgi:dihydropteroate synthase